MRPLTRRGFLKLAGAAGAAMVLPRSAFSSEELRISVLHTTDLHGHILPTSTYEGEPDLGGFARCAAQIRAWKEENPHWLLLDAGDVYQGTEAGWRTRGAVMARGFNLLGYDAWIIGNHEFDWGIEPLAAFCKTASAPALSANAELGEPAREHLAAAPPRPWILKEVAGLRIGVIGLTTPGLPFWFLPQFTAGFSAADPAAAARRAADELLAEKADAIILCVHMGTRPGGDDFANHVEAVARAVPGAALIIGGHTHKDVPRAEVAGIPYTQANYFGICAGRAELVFAADSRRLLRVETSTRRMDGTCPMDPAVLSMAASDLEESAQILAAPAGLLREQLSPEAPRPGEPSQVESLIALAIRHALAEKGVQTDAVFHGLFSSEPVPAGPKTIADIWKILPYENFVVTGELTSDEILGVMEEVLGGRRAARRSLAGLEIKYEERGASPRPVAVGTTSGAPVGRGPRLRVAMNTYDAAGGGRHLLRLREFMARPEARATIHPVQTREALIDYLRAAGEKGIGTADLRWPAA